LLFLGIRYIPIVLVLVDQYLGYIPLQEIPTVPGEMPFIAVEVCKIGWVRLGAAPLISAAAGGISKPHLNGFPDLQ